MFLFSPWIIRLHNGCPPPEAVIEICPIENNQTYPVLHPPNSGPQLMEDVTEEGDEDEERDKEDKNSNSKIENFSRGICPTREVSYTFRLKKRRHLRDPELHSEDVDAGEGGEEGDQPGSYEEFVWRARYGERPGDGTVSVQGDGHQHVVGGGQGEGLQELGNRFIII